MRVSVIPVLPVELITEILLKLRPKPLFRFKCVSKSWLQLISSPNFVKTHMKLAANDEAFSSHRVIYLGSKGKFKVCCLPSLFRKETNTKVFDLDSPMGKPPISYSVVGSANGLICFFIDLKEAFIWNPIIRKLKNLPKLEVNIGSGWSYIQQHGFGYDELHDDYKVVVMYSIFGRDGSYDTVVNVYSLRTDTWGTVNNFQGNFIVNSSGKFANGKIYWDSRVSSAGAVGHSVCNIVSLNLADETLGKLELPCYGECNSHLILGEVGRDLSMLCTCREGTTSDVWIMKDCGVNVSWTKMFTIKYPQDDVGKYMKYMLNSPVFNVTTHICPSNNGEILLLLPPIIVIYNPKDDSIRQLEIIGFKKCPDAKIFVETLVDPLLIADRRRHNLETAQSCS